MERASDGVSDRREDNPGRKGLQNLGREDGLTTAAAGERDRQRKSEKVHEAAGQAAGPAASR